MEGAVAAVHRKWMARRLDEGRGREQLPMLTRRQRQMRVERMARAWIHAEPSVCRRPCALTQRASHTAQSSLPRLQIHP